MINTNVPSGLLAPGTNHTFSFMRVGSALTPLPLRMANVGMMKGGTAVASTLYEIVDAEQSDALCGIGTELAIMNRLALSLYSRYGKGPRLFMVGVAEPGASVAATRTFTHGGVATADGNEIVRLGGRYFTVGVRAGDVANTIATRLSDAMKATDVNNPFATSVAAPVVTGTYRTTGTNGNDLVAEVIQTVPGLTCVAATGVVGTGTPNIQPAIDALAPVQYDGIAVSTHIAGDVTILNADFDARWSATSKFWRYYFMGETSSIGAATALQAAANRRGILVGNYRGSPSLPGELAVFDCFVVNATGKPNAIFNGKRGPIHPPSPANAYTATELETILLAGGTPHQPILGSDGAIVQGESKIVRMVTTKTTANALPYYLEREIGSSRTGVFYARQIDIQAEARFGTDNNPDGVYLTDDYKDQVKDMVAEIARAMGEDGTLRDVEADLAQNRYEFDDVTPGQTNGDIYYTPTPGAHRLAIRHNIKIR